MALSRQRERKDERKGKLSDKAHQDGANSLESINSRKNEKEREREREREKGRKEGRKEGRQAKLKESSRFTQIHSLGTWFNLLLPSLLNSKGDVAD